MSKRWIVTTLRRRLSLITLALLIVSAGGCTSSVTHHVRPDFSPREPLRVAVLPFFRISEEGNHTNRKEDLAIDHLPLVSSPLNESVSTLVQNQVITALQNTAFEVVSPSLIAIDLPHHGFALEDGSLDYEKLRATDPQEICYKFLDCDALILGTISKWDRSYYGVQSVATVKLSLDLISARDRMTIFRAEGEDYESHGISKGPTGISDLVVEPIKGLDSENLVDLSRALVSKIIAPLTTNESLQNDKTPPPEIYAVAHDGTSSPLQHSSTLVVLLFGAPGCSASFSIGDAIVNIPMVERSAGQYYGEYFPTPVDRFTDKTVRVTLRDQKGRSTSQEIPNKPVSLP